MDTVANRWTAHTPGHTDEPLPTESGTKSSQWPVGSSPKPSRASTTRHCFPAEVNRSRLPGRGVRSGRCSSIRSSPSTAKGPSTATASCYSRGQPGGGRPDRRMTHFRVVVRRAVGPTMQLSPQFWLPRVPSPPELSRSDARVATPLTQPWKNPAIVCTDAAFFSRRSRLKDCFACPSSGCESMIITT